MEELLLFLIANLLYLAKERKINNNKYFSFITNIIFSILLYKVYLHTGAQVPLYFSGLFYLTTLGTLLIPNWNFLLFLIISDLKVNSQLLFYHIMLTKKFCHIMAEKSIILLNMTYRYKNAIKLTNKVLQVKRSTNILNHKLYALLRIEDYHKANEIVEEILEYNHTNSYFLTIKADISFQLKNYQEALNFYEKVLFYKPKSIEIMYNMGKAHFELEHYDKSELLLKKVISTNSFFIPAFITLVKLYLKQNLKEPALKVLEEVKDKIPEASEELKKEVSSLFNKAEQL